MRLSAKALINYGSVNQFDYANQWIIRANEPNTLYFQLVDLDQDELRYMAGISLAAGVVVTFPSVDDAQVIAANAVQETNDKSIWKVVLSSIQKPNSGSVVFALTEGTVTSKFSVLNLISVEYLNEGSC